MIAGHYNNKSNKVVSRTSSCRISSPCRNRISSYLNRHHRRTRGNMHRPAPRTTTETTTGASTVPAILPQFLGKPPLKEVNIEELYKFSPELKAEQAPAPFIREFLEDLSTHMLAGIAGAQISAPTNRLPKELQVIMSDPISLASITPTHVLALTSTVKPALGSKPKVVLYLIHQIVFAANCSSMPPLPSSLAATPEGNMTETATLPVVCLTVPSPNSFGYLSTYIYTKDLDLLRRSFLPPNWAASIGSIMQHALIINGVWANACCLGVVDSNLYHVIDECWAQVIRALHQVTSTPSP